jgi:hypothetical protein
MVKKVLMRIFGSKRDEMTGELRKIHNEKPWNNVKQGADVEIAAG